MTIDANGLVPLIQVFDMPEAIRFYCGLLGFEIVGASPEIEAAEGRYFHWAWLRLGGADLMLNTAYDSNQRPPARDAPRWQGHRDVSLYIDCADVDAAYADLRAKGLELDPPEVAPYGMKQLKLEDPDGYGLCLQMRA
jgi:uncharacterized glyoxalase superfamily protein PhnB